MIKGFYSAVSAMLVNANRQQLLAHNVANLDTPGFKQILSTMEEFEHTAVSFPAGNIVHSRQLSPVGILGLGVQGAPEEIDFTQGGLRNTGNDFDFAIQGEGFFRIETPEGERYTRDGRFLVDTEGTLVTVDGYSVLDDNGQPIQLEDGEVLVASDGTITVNGEEAARLGLAAFENPAADLERTEGNLFSAVGQPVTDASFSVLQRYLESSNANPTQIMAQLVEVARSYEAAQKMVQNQDELLGKSIAMLGRIA